MSGTSDFVTITLPRRLLEHPRAFHVHRMRSAVWLYLLLVSRLVPESDEVDVDPVAVAAAMGLPEGTVLSWIGHLRKCRYVEARRRNGLIRVRVKRRQVRPTGDAPVSARFFTVAKLEHALGETGHRDILEPALASHADPVVKRALAGALAVPSTEIRRSRTALFLYLLKRHAHEEQPNDSRS